MGLLDSAEPRMSEETHSMAGMFTLRAALAGGPGLDGYAYCADVYCVDCGRNIIRDRYAEMERDRNATHFDWDSFRDSDELPQPIFFGESEYEQHCADCGEYLYGESDAE